MKKYGARICEVAKIEFSAEQFLRLQVKNVDYDNKTIPCKCIVTNNSKNKVFFILYPVDSFEVMEDE